MKNYYEILEVNKKASQEIIEKAYKVLVKKYHPDLYSGKKKEYAEEKIKEINEAYDILSDAFLKEQYDKQLEIEEAKKYERYEKYERQEENINRQYKKQSRTRNIQNTNKVTKNTQEKQEIKHEIGSFGSIIDLCKELFKNKPKREEFKEMTRKDILAIFLTVITVIIIGIILWFIPFTNGWMRELLFENPLFNWIGGLFSN